MTQTLRPLVAVFALATTFLLWAAGGCGGNKNGNFGDESTTGGSPGSPGDDATTSASGSSGGQPGFGGTSSGFTPGDGGNMPDCPAGSPLSCYVNMNCANGAQTMLTGKVFDPAGKNPIYNVVVFVPNDPNSLPAITPGTSSCSACDTSVGDYVTAALTDQNGSFTLKGVPTGKNVPLVVQIGKWRRTITVPNVADCKTTTVPSSGSGQARLPRNQQEGSMPQMALLTGGLDDLGCFLTKVGIDAKEYSAPGAGGRLDIYQGLGGQGLGGLGKAPGLSTGTAGNCTNTSCPLWASKQSFEAYDIVFLACEGNTYDPDDDADGGGPGQPIFGGGGGGANVTQVGKQAMHDWLNEGGKVFATHFHYTWFKNGPPDFQSIATWLGSSVGSGTCTNCTIDTSLPSGKDFQTWLQGVGALSGSGITLTGVADSVSTVNQSTTTRWIYGSSGLNTGATDTKYLSFETPIGGIDVDAGEATGKKYCGKAVFTDLHAGGSPSGDIPGSCQSADLTAQEKALEFLIFNLAACVSDESKPMMLPPPPPK
jgi:hypothetical protein